MSDKIPPRFRKTKSDTWAVMAPAEDLEKALAEGGKIDVQKRSGDWSSFTVASLGKPFDVDGVQMCYGYGPEAEDDGASNNARSNQSDRSGNGGGQRPAAQRSSKGSRRSESRTSAAPAPPVDPSEPLPEYQGGPEDEWDGYF